MIDDLQRRLKEYERRGVTLRVGVVSTVSPLAVKLGDSAIAYTSVKRLASYTPTLSDTVAVLVAGNDCLVLGKIA